MPDVLLEPEVMLAIGAAALVVALILLVLLIRVARQLSALRREHSEAFPDSHEDVVSVLGRHNAELADVREDLATVHANTEHLRDLLRGTVSRVGVVRYDAFDDMGGALSFSAALLDEHGDGILISAINGRTETRAYGKPVKAGASEHTLSHEELEAIASAIDRRDPATVPTGGRRKRRAS